METPANLQPFWLRPASYWLPPKIVTSAWLEHAPFAYWLVDVLRPGRIVELGTHYGFSFFVFCEAARRLGLSAEIFALDSWEGDHQAGFYGDEVFDSVQAVIAEAYPSHGRTIRGYFNDSRTEFTAGSVDLLHIDGRHRYEDAREDFYVWRSTVRDGGVVVFHDIEERSGDFGVWRLWDELKGSFPSFSFVHGHGLGIIGIGAVPEPLLQLFNATQADVDLIRRTYEHLGAVVTRQAAFEDMPAEIDSLHEVVDSLVAENIRLVGVIAERDSTIAERDSSIDEILSSTSWRIGAPIRKLGSLGKRGQRSRVR